MFARLSRDLAARLAEAQESTASIEPEFAPLPVLERCEGCSVELSDSLRLGAQEPRCGETLLERALRLKNEIQSIARALAIPEDELVKEVDNLEMRSMVVEQSLRLALKKPATATHVIARELLLFYETSEY